MEEIKFQTVVKFLSQKQKLIVSSQYRYDMRHVVMSLNNSSIDSIKHQFQQNESRLDLYQFVWLMRQALNKDDQQSQLICYELVKLFEEIDIDSSSTIQWSQFLEYLSQTNWLAAPAFKAAFNSKQTNVLVHAFHEEAKHRKNTLKKIIELPRHSSLALLTNNHALNFLNYDQSSQTNSQQFEDQASKIQFSLHHIDHAKVLSIDYSEEQRLFGVLLTNRNLCFIQDGQIQKNLGFIRSSGNQIDIKYLPIHRLWVVQSANSNLEIFPSPKSSQISQKMVFHPHQQPITSIKEVLNPLTMCTSSLDGIIKLWQLTSGHQLIEFDITKQRFVDEKKGIKGMTVYNRGQVSYICAWMFTTQILLWLPSLSLSKPYAGQLIGHLGLIVDCAFAWRGQLISLDDKRSIRVWNPEKFECLQCFTISQQNSSLLVLRAQPYLVTYSRLLNFYRIRTNSKADLLSEVGYAGKDGKNVLAFGEGHNKLISIDFSSYYCFFIIITSQQMKIFDINHIVQITVVRPPSSAEFVYSTMKNNRRICIALSSGIIQQYKLQDGQIVARIDTNITQQQQLKFIYFHEQTKILIVIVQGQHFSKLITYDLITIDSLQKIKQIQFQQLNLLDFKMFKNTNKFFILSSDPSITIWDYDKLCILNKINLEMVTGPISQGNINIILQPINQCIIVQTGKNIAFLFIDIFGQITKIKLLQYNQPQQEGQINTCSLILQKISQSYLAQQKAKKTKRQMQLEGKRKVDFKIFDHIGDNQSDSDSYAQMFIIAITNNKDQVLYYQLSEILNPFILEQTRPLKGKLPRVKQHRKAHMKQLPWNGKITKFQFQDHKFGQAYGFVPNVCSSGVLLGLFYFHTNQNVLFFYTPYAQIKGQWTLSLPKPKTWNISYNEINQVLKRLQQTQKAIQFIFQANVDRFKIQFLISKYLFQQQIQQLKKIQQRCKKDVKSTVFFSHNQLGSKKSIVSINQKLTGAPIISKKQIVSKQVFLNPFEKKDNPFVKKLTQQQKQKFIHTNQKDIFQKVKKSLAYSKHNRLLVRAESAKKMKGEHQQRSNFIVKMDNVLNSLLKQPDQNHIEDSSVKSQKKQTSCRRSSFNTGLNFPENNTQLFRTRSLGSKNRIKSSISDLIKNFAVGKIEVQNFRKNFKQSLQKKGKLKL